MNDLDVRFNRRLAFLVAGSLLFFTMVTIFRLGIGAIPYDLTDGAGHPTGFNDPLYPGHYWLMVQRFHPRDFLRREFVYEWVLLAAHGVGLGLLLAAGRVPSRLTRWFFALQTLAFPWGFPLGPVLLGCLVYPGPGHFGTDREFWTDAPTILILAAPVWVWVSLVVAWRLRGEKLGLWPLVRQLFAGRRRNPGTENPPGQVSPEGLRRVQAGV